MKIATSAPQSMVMKTAAARPAAAPAEVSAPAPADAVQLSLPFTTANFEVKSRWSELTRVACEKVTNNLVPVLFLSDLDGTWLSPDPANRQALDQGVQQLKQEAREQGIDLQFGYISARPLERITAENLPAADWTVSDNGGFIYHTSVSGEIPEESWEKHKQSFGFNAQMALEAAAELARDPRFLGMHYETVGKVLNNPAADACPESAFFCVSNDSIRFADGESATQLGAETFEAPRQVNDFASELSARLQGQGAEFKTSPVYPYHGKPYVMFDLASVNKGDAIQFLREEQGVTLDHIIIAGDGGNDISMMTDSGQDDGRRAIVVGGNVKLRQAAAGVSRAVVQNPEMDCSLGVLDGLRRHLAEIAGEVRAA